MPDVFVPQYAQNEHKSLGGAYAAASNWSDGRICANAGRGALPCGTPVWRGADAVARVERADRARDGPALRPRREGCTLGRMAVLCALREGDQRAQEGAQRRHL